MPREFFRKRKCDCKIFRANPNICMGYMSEKELYTVKEFDFLKKG